MDLPAGSVLLVFQGECRVVACTPDQLVDPADWIDLSAYEMVSGIFSLGKPPVLPELKTEPIRKSLASILTEPMPEAVPEREALFQSFAEKQKKRGSRTKGNFFRWLGAWFKKKKRVPTFADNTVHAPQFPQNSNTGPGWKKFFSRFITATGLWHLFADMQSRYFRKMMRMFEQGDLQDALRHAIPLSKTGEMAPHLPAWLNPRPRRDLKVSPVLQTGGSSYHFDHGICHYIHQLYEKAFERLDRENRIENAVFVLAELLQDSARAVSYLEKKDRLIQAAELAESRNLSPGIVIRQWFLAGKIERAVDIARRTGAFAEAVLLLEKSHANKALTLRLLWAKFLAQAGNYEGAVTTAWQIKEARGLVENWIEQAIRFGGDAGARLFAHRLLLDPGKFADTRNRLEGIMKKTDPGHAIALAPRGDVYRISRIHIDEQKAGFWQEAKLDAHVDTFDGAVWFVTMGKSLVALDIQDKSFKSLWRVSDLPGLPTHVARSEHRVSLMIAEEKGDFSVWTYELPSIVLRNRGYIEPGEAEAIWEMGLSPEGILGIFHAPEVYEDRMVLKLIRKSTKRMESAARIEIVCGAIRSLRFTESWWTICVEDELGMNLYLLDNNESKIRLHLHLARTKQLTIRFVQGEMIIGDDQGRLILIEMEYGAILQSLCI